MCHIHYNRLFRHYNFKFWNIRSSQVWDVIKQILKKKCNGWVLSLCVTLECTLCPSFFCFFKEFKKKKNCIIGYFSWIGPNAHISPRENALLKQLWNSIFCCLLSLCHMKLLLVEKTYSWSSFQDKQRQYPLIKQIYIWHFFNKWCSLYIYQDLSHSQFGLEAIYLCLNWYVEGML